MTLERLTLKSVTARPVLIPLKRPVVAKLAKIEQWPLILIDLETEEGIVGRSYLEPYIKDAAKYIVPAILDLANARKGKKIHPFGDFQSSRKALNFVGYEGVTMIAVAGLDMAAWDALAKAVNMPLATLLGGAPGSLPAYNSNGLWLGDPAAAGDEAAELVGEGGFSALKIRLGRQNLKDDLDAIARVRASTSADIKLMADLNQGLTFGDALRRCHALDGEGLYWFEEPVTYNNFRAHAQLTRELKTPVSLGENFYGPEDLFKAVEAGAGDYLMPDLMRIGGISGWLRSAPIAGAAGIELSSHLYPEVSAHLLSVTETAHWLEWQNWADPILLEPFEVSDGRVTIPDRPGSGIEWNENAVKRFSYHV